jgi:16S rRNA (uracil1498-N3)-methyltransferase
MSAHRFFLTGPLAGGGAESLLALSADDVHHAVDVLRLRVGEEIDVVEPGARVWRVTVTQVGAEGVCGNVLREVPAVASPHVTLFQGVAKGEKMDAIVRQATEVGAEQIVPVLTARSVVQLDARKRADRGERWRRVARAAAKQAKRTSIPGVSDPITLHEASGELAGYDGVIVVWEECPGGPGIDAAVRSLALGTEPRIALMVGPEGGLTAEEVETLVALGAVSATLGPTILRTETAAVVALSLAVFALGGLGGTGA